MSKHYGIGHRKVEDCWIVACPNQLWHSVDHRHASHGRLIIDELYLCLLFLFAARRVFMPYRQVLLRHLLSACVRDESTSSRCPNNTSYKFALIFFYSQQLIIEVLF